MMVKTGTFVDVPEAVLDEIAADLITTAVEGAINYWASVSDYTWAGPGYGHSDGRPWADGDTQHVSVTVYETDGDDPEHGHTVDVAAMRVALLRVVAGECKPFFTPGYERRYETRVVDALRKVAAGTPLDQTDYDFDASDADCMMQLAVLGEVVYG